MKKLIIVITGIYIVLMGILSILLLGLMATNPADAEMVPGAKNISIIMLSGIGILLVATGVGVILTKNWARISLIIISSFTLFGGIASSAVTILMPPIQEARLEGVENYKSIMLGATAIVSIFLVFIPIFFLVFFNRRKVKEIFIIPGQNKSPLPFGIKLIALFFGTSGALSLPLNIFLGFRKTPLFFGIILPEGVSLIYAVVFSLLYIYIAIGFFKLNKKAWIAAIAVHTYLLFAAIAHSLTVTQEQLDLVTAQSANRSYALSLVQYKSMGLFGLSFTLVILVYLLIKKNVFYDAHSSKTKLWKP